jgi:cytidyltransferase-like protein
MTIAKEAHGCQVLCCGTFNIVHAGHVQLFEFASQFGKVTVGINADSYLHNKYGKDKTVPLMNRAYVVSSCKYVHDVVVFTQADPSALIRQLAPGIYIRGPDYSGVELPEQEALDDVRAQLIIQCADKIHNASSLVEFVSQSAFAAMSTKATQSWKKY